MTFFSIDDPGLWGRGMEKWEAITEQGGLNGLAVANFVLGEPEENAPAAAILRLDAGHVLARHAHNCYRLEVVIQGSMTAGDRVLKPGSIMYSKPHEFYGPHVAGPDGCTTVEIFSTYDATHTTVVETPTGIMECDLWTSEGAERMMEYVRGRACGH